MTKRAIAAIIAILAAVLMACVALATPSAAYPTKPPQCAAGQSRVGEHGRVGVSCSHFKEHHHVKITLHSKVYNLGSANTGSTGSFSKTVRLPQGVVGNHTIDVTDPATGQTASISITITNSGTAGVATSSGSGSGGLSSTGVAVIGIGALGVVLLVGGGLMMLAGRRRKVAA